MIHRFIHHEDPMPQLKRPLLMFYPRLGVQRERERERRRRQRKSLGLQGWLTRIFVALTGYIVAASCSLSFLADWNDRPWFRAVAGSVFIAGMLAMLIGAALMLLPDDRH